MNASPTVEVADAAQSLATNIASAFKTLKSLRSELPVGVRGLDHAALPLLFTLDTGPRRVSALADACHADLSSTSRYATALTRFGLVEKTPDPTDGRAQVLVITDAGRALVSQIREQRGQIFLAVLGDWEPDDIRRFDDYLKRFVDDVVHHLNPAPAGPTDTRKED